MSTNIVHKQSTYREKCKQELLREFEMQKENQLMRNGREFSEIYIQPKDDSRINISLNSIYY